MGPDSRSRSCCHTWMQQRQVWFPSEVTDDPILSLVSPEGEPFRHAEERRIMYVEMTRARSTVTLLASEAEPSCFVRELVSDSEYGLATSTGSMPGHVPCSDCGGRLLPVPARDGRVWYRCEHSLMCSNYMPSCSHCGIGMPMFRGLRGASNAHIVGPITISARNARMAGLWRNTGVTETFSAASATRTAQERHQWRKSERAR